MSSVKSQESRLEGLGYCFSQFVLRCKDNKKHSNGQIFHQKYAAVKDPPPDEGRGHRVLKARITQINTDEYISGIRGIRAKFTVKNTRHSERIGPAGQESRPD